MRRPRSALLALHLALACDGSGAPPDAAVDPTTKTADRTPPAPVADVPAAPEAPPNDGELGEAPPPPAADPAPPGDRPTAMVPEVELTAADVLAALERAAAGNHDTHGFDWHRRAAALIERDPKLRQTLVDRLREPACAHDAREFGVAMLVTRGHPDVQAALRQVLGDPVVRGARDYWMLVPRLGAVPGPDEQTIELTFSVRSSDEPKLRHTATMALGGHIAALIASERSPAAANLAARLRSTLEAESTPEQQALLVEALGLGGHPQSRGFIRGFARSKAPALRRAAARGMLRDESREAPALLLELLVDPDPDVQSAAVESLVERPLDAAQQRVLHEATIAGRVTPRSDTMLTILISRRLHGDARKAALEVLLARNTRDDYVRRDIVAALASG